MVLEKLDIDVNVDLNGAVGKLEALASSLHHVSAAQEEIDESMAIDVEMDTDALDDLQNASASMGLESGDGETPTIESADIDIANADINIADSALGRASASVADGGVPDGGEEGRRMDHISGPGLLEGDNFFEYFKSQVDTSVDEYRKSNQIGDMDLQYSKDFNAIDGSPTDGGGRSRGVFSRMRNAFSETLDEIGKGSNLFEKLNLNMSMFYDILASMIPLLFNFVAAMPAAIAALGTLAGAAMATAGAIGGIAALGLGGLALERGNGNLGKGIQKLVKDLRETFINTFRPVMEMFEGLAREGIRGLERLFASTARVMRSFSSLKEEARALGGFVMSMAPMVVASIRRIAEAFSPVFAMLGSWLQKNLPNVISGFITITRKALPPLFGLVDAFMEILPAITRISIGFLYVTELIFSFVGAISQVVNWLGPVGKALGFATGILLTFISVVATAVALHSLWAKLMLGDFLTAIYSSVTALIAQAQAEGILTVATEVLTSALMALRAVLITLGIGIVIGAIGLAASKFMGLDKSVRNATKSLKDFKRVQGGLNTDMGGSYSSAYGGQWTQGSGSTAVVDNSTTKIVVNGDGGKENAAKSYQKGKFLDSTFSGY